MVTTLEITGIEQQGTKEKSKAGRGRTDRLVGLVGTHLLPNLEYEEMEMKMYRWRAEAKGPQTVALFKGILNGSIP